MSDFDRLSLRCRCLCKAAYLYGGVLQFGIPTLAVVTAFLLDLSLAAWVVGVLGLVVWWYGIARLVANTITWALAYALGIPREMRKVIRIEHRMEVAKHRAINRRPLSGRSVARPEEEE